MTSLSRAHAPTRWLAPARHTPFSRVRSFILKDDALSRGWREEANLSRGLLWNRDFTVTWVAAATAGGNEREE